MTLSDLPEIQIIRNVRATRLRLRVDGQQIKVTAPVFCSNRQIQKFIADAEGWLLKTWQAQQAQLQQIDQSLPAELQLFNLNTPIQISYQSQKQNFIWDESALQLWISDRHSEAYLKTFMIAYAKQHLPLYLKQLSLDTGLNFNGCNIRQPKTRWGSCSARHDIMLNSALVLMPEAICRYVCVHELAHTRHFDHSPRFWAEVARHDPEFQAHRQFLKRFQLPYWWLG
ncbi:M48 family metallopeptidase [Acinetobacter indicus]|uniref:M48 family metallopeptidase n=1 Tax=Acinetobacter indicus TaxID=756892 RepID=UPI000CEBE64B|nr:SprT family zinc-dependent metalloprotease [Acinetobacter indicus]MCO8103246.1 M48 family metallopeptidase [Acinetobacter indicus]